MKGQLILTQLAPFKTIYQLIGIETSQIHQRITPVNKVLQKRGSKVEQNCNLGLQIHSQDAELPVLGDLIGL